MPRLAPHPSGMQAAAAGWADRRPDRQQPGTHGMPSHPSPIPIHSISILRSHLLVKVLGLVLDRIQGAGGVDQGGAAAGDDALLHCCLQGLGFRVLGFRVYIRDALLHCCLAAGRAAAARGAGGVSSGEAGEGKGNAGPVAHTHRQGCAARCRLLVHHAEGPAGRPASRGSACQQAVAEAAAPQAAISYRHGSPSRHALGCQALRPDRPDRPDQTSRPDQTISTHEYLVVPTRYLVPD